MSNTHKNKRKENNTITIKPKDTIILGFVFIFAMLFFMSMIANISYNSWRSENVAQIGWWRDLSLLTGLSLLALALVGGYIRHILKVFKK